MHKELKVGWDHATLMVYVEKRMIKRGLRLKKNTTTTYPPEFHADWNDALSKCSFDLMTLIIKQESLQLTAFDEEIKQLKQDIISRMPAKDWTDWIEKTQSNLIKTETLINNTKQSKFVRDQKDYDNNCVYSWPRERPAKYGTKSILKNADRATVQHIVDALVFQIPTHRWRLHNYYSKDYSNLTDMTCQS